jgi:hypothetical protein
MFQSGSHRKISIMKFNVFTHEGNFDFAFGVADGIAPLLPVAEIGFRRLELKVVLTRNHRAPAHEV